MMLNLQARRLHRQARSWTCYRRPAADLRAFEPAPIVPQRPSGLEPCDGLHADAPRSANARWTAVTPSELGSGEVPLSDVLVELRE